MTLLPKTQSLSLIHSIATEHRLHPSILCAQTWGSHRPPAPVLPLYPSPQLKRDLLLNHRPCLAENQPPILPGIPCQHTSWAGQYKRQHTAITLTENIDVKEKLRNKIPTQERQNQKSAPRPILTPNAETQTPAKNTINNNQGNESPLEPSYPTIEGPDDSSIAEA